MKINNGYDVYVAFIMHIMTVYVSCVTFLWSKIINIINYYYKF